MRKLATAAFSFGAAVLLSQYLLPNAFELFFALGCVALGAASFLLRGNKRARAALIFFGAAVGFLWNWAYHAEFVLPAENTDGARGSFSASVNDFPNRTAYGYSVDIKVSDIDGKNIRTLAYFYDDEAGALRPGDKITFYGTLSLSDSIRDRDTDYYTSKGYFLLARRTSGLTVVSSPGFRLGYIHRWLARAIKDKVAEIFPSDSAGFMQALLTGDKMLIAEDVGVVGALKRTGVYHIIVVSGMHVSVLSGFILLLTGKKRRALFIIFPLLILFAGVSGFTPSVMRAVIMQFFLLTAPLLGREDDSLTSLSAAMVFILLINPYAAAGASFQLSFAATLGIILFSSKLYGFFDKIVGGDKKGKAVRSLKRILIGGLSASIAASVLTTPFIALYFGYVSLISPLVNLLILWAVTPLFCMGLSAVAAGFIFAPAGKAIAWVCAWFVRYIVWITKATSGSVFSVVYLDSIPLICWFVVLYLTVLLFIALKASPRQLILPASIAVIALCVILLWNARPPASQKDGSGLSTAVLDVGQGQCVVIYGGGYTAVVDCGSTSGDDAGEAAARFLYGMGVRRIDLLVLTHYHSDHANGVRKLMSYVDVDLLAGPEYYEYENDLGDETEALAAEKNSAIIYITEDTDIEMGDIRLRLFAPMGTSSENERGVCVLASAGDYDVLITGDIDSSLERKLIYHTDLPDIECLVAGHHGSRYSTCEELLSEVTPEVAVISVGYNDYGHPSSETLKRLREAGVTVFRTDESGDINLTPSGEK